MKFLFLGTGGSLGIPVIGCSCDVCKSETRLRCSGLLTINGKRFLIDPGPDVRQQMLTYNIDSIDGLLVSHTHYDHIGGLDDLRPFIFKKPIPTLLSQESLDDITLRFHYLKGLNYQVLENDFGTVTFEGVKLTYVSYVQAGMKVTGFRFGDFAYITDIQDYTDKVCTQLEGTETLVVSALRFEQSAVHFNIDDAIDFSDKVGAKNVYFIHITHSIAHDKSKLPQHIRLAYDGLEI